jgi:hypothetical protein
MLSTAEDFIDFFNFLSLPAPKKKEKAAEEGRKKSARRRPEGNERAFHSPAANRIHRTEKKFFANFRWRGEKKSS